MKLNGIEFSARVVAALEAAGRATDSAVESDRQLLIEYGREHLLRKRLVGCKDWSTNAVWTEYVNVLHAAERAIRHEASRAARREREAVRATRCYRCNQLGVVIGCAACAALSGADQ